MNQPMSFADARELCELRIKEDGISPATALREFRDLTHCGLREAEPTFRHFQRLEQQIKDSK